MDMENKKLELKIPEKVSDHQYVIQGIGKHEIYIGHSISGSNRTAPDMCYIRKYYNRVIYWSCNRDNHVLFINKRQCK